MRLRDELGVLYDDQDCAALFATRGQPAESPSHILLVLVLQCMDGLTDRQAADAVRGRIDWKYALGLDLTDPGFDFSIVREFRARIIAADAVDLLLDRVLIQCTARGLLKGRGKQRTDSTHVLAAIRTMNRLECVGEAMAHTLHSLLQIDPAWVQANVPSNWLVRYGMRFDDFRLPTALAKRTALAEQIGRDGMALMTAIYAATAPCQLRQLPALDVLRRIWVQQYYVEDDTLCWRMDRDVPPHARLLVSPYDPDARFGVKRDIRWTGYKLHLTETCDDDSTIQGGLIVCLFPPNADDGICDPPYWRPEKEGRLKIVAVTEPRLTLESVIGSRYVFNVETRQWEAAPDVPVPTATPLPTDVPPPTFTPLTTATNTPAPTEPPTAAAATDTPLPTVPPTATATPTSPPVAAPAADVIVRHAPTINGTGRIDGSVQQLLGEALTLNGNAQITGDLRVPGSPRVVQNGASTIGATATGDGSAQPEGYRLTLNGNAQLGRLVTRAEAVVLPDVAAPAPPSGTRTVTINQAGQPLGDPATLRNLTLNSNAGTANLPPGSYGRMTLNGSSALVLGVAGDTQPAAYTFQALTLNGTSQIHVVGPVQITLATGGAWHGTLGDPAHLAWLTLRVAGSNVTLNGDAALYGTLDAPASAVTLNGQATLVGALRADRLTLTTAAVLSRTLPQTNVARPRAGRASRSPVSAADPCCMW